MRVEKEAKPSVVALAKRTLSEFMEDQPFQLAAALSYYTLLSLAPLILVLVGLAGLLFGQSAARGHLMGKIQATVGPQVARAIQGMLAHASAAGPGTGLLSTIIGLVLVAVGASTIFVQLQVALNRIWKVRSGERQRSAIGRFIRQRLLSMATVLGLVFLLLVSLLLSTFISALHGHLASLFPGAAILFRILNIVVSLAVITGLIAVIFFFLPDASTAWRDVWLGAFITSVLLPSVNI
jgi:membrane protein